MSILKKNCKFKIKKKEKVTSFFISDLHFGLLSKEQEKLREKSFVKFLEFAKYNSNKLFILGDLFDYWFEYKRVIQKGYYRTFTALEDLVDAGIEVNYFIGNHDFMHLDFFKDIGLKIYPDFFDVTLDNKRFFLAHGDGLVANDLGYKILKKVLRNKFNQKLYSLLHPDLGIWLASLSSKKSRDFTTEKSYGDINGMFEAAKEKINLGFDYVIFGHSHKREFEKYNLGYYINLGTWLTQPCYAKYSNNKFEIIDWIEK